MSASITVSGVPYQYDAEADAGIYLSSGERWWGSRIKWRAGTAGRWQHVIIQDLHPMDYSGVADALRLVIERRMAA